MNDRLEDIAGRVAFHKYHEYSTMDIPVRDVRDVLDAVRNVRDIHYNGGWGYCVAHPWSEANGGLTPWPCDTYLATVLPGETP